MALKGSDNLGTPKSSVEVSESVRGHALFRPAPWLPTLRYDRRAEDYVVMNGGVAVTAVNPIDGQDQFADLVPAGLMRSVRDDVTGSNVLFTYTTADIDAGVIDVRTRELLVTGGLGNVIRSELIVAIPGFAEAFPIGISTYNYYVWAGGDGSNPSLFTNTNYQTQPTVAVTFDYLIEVPVLDAVAETVTEVAAATVGGGSYTHTSGDIVPTNPVDVGFLVPALGDIGVTATVYIDGVDVSGDVSAASGTTITFTVATQTVSAGNVITISEEYDTSVTDIDVGRTVGVTINGVAATIDAVVAGAPDTISLFDNVVIGDTLVITYFDEAVMNNPLVLGAPVLNSGAGAIVNPGAYVSPVGYVAGGSPTVVSNEYSTSAVLDENTIGQIVAVNRTFNEGLLERVRTFYAAGLLNTSGAGIDQQLMAMQGSATGGLTGEAYRALATTFNGVARINLLK